MPTACPCSLSPDKVDAKLIAQKANCLQVARAAVRAGIASHLEWLNQEIERLPQTIRAHIDRDLSLAQHTAPARLYLRP